MTGPALFEKAGAQAKNPTPWAPVFIERFGDGLYTNRSPLTPAGSIIENLYYGGKNSALIGGSNVEVTVRNTIQRRPGLSAFSTATYPTPPARAFSFELTDGSIRVLIDTSSTGNLAVSSAGISSGGTAPYTGTFPGAGSNAYAGLIFQVAGFTNPSNNGVFTCTASSTTTLTLTNAIAFSETTSAAAITAGAVYWDQQSGAKTLLFAKAPGAGQAHFVAVAGLCYIGDGVDTRVYNPTNPNAAIWNWGIQAPAAQPSVQVVQSGAASIQWVANTIFSTVGLVYDQANNAIYQLNSVNASGTNTTELGTSGSGQPAWAGIGGTTTDNTITWTNIGPVVAWSANTTYNNASIGGTTANPCAVYIPAPVNAVFINIDPSNAAGKSGATPPKWVNSIGAIVHDGQVKWQCVGVPGTWKKSTSYPKIGTVSNNNNVSLVVEPTGLQNGLPTNQTIYLQASGGGTSAASATSPFNASTNSAGALTTDGDLIWLSLGSDQWTATTPYSGWSASGTVFSAIKDSNNNFQVCIQTGSSATVQPGTSFTLSAVANQSGGTTVYSGTFSPTLPASTPTATLNAVISGFTNAANNGTFKIISCTATQLTVQNGAGAAETHAGTAIYNPWGTGYGNQTVDGSSIWTCVGTASGMTWTAATKWFLPSYGFAPPSTSQPFGGSSVIDSNSNLEFAVNSGLSGAAAPTWNATSGYTDDNGTSLTLSQVAVASGIATYTGTITGGGSNAFAGQAFLISGFTNAGNNILINVLSSTATTLTCTATSQVNETHAGTAKNGLIWLNLEPFSTNSLAWTKGYVYAYSFKSRTLSDFYSVNVSGTSNPPVPPGLGNPLPAPTGSLIGDISSASPVFTITGANAGAVNTISGMGSTNPAVDTIVIWRSADGGGSANMFELTEIPAPGPIGSIAQPWSFKDFLPDTPTSVYPGLNTLESAPINGVNNPPPSTALPMEYNFERIWCASGQQVLFSGGPDVQVGNPQSAFNPGDEFPFLSNVIRIVKSTQGSVVYTSNSIEIILGGPATASFYQVTLAPGIGLGNYNALDIFAGEQFFMSTDGMLRILSPSLSLSSTGFPIADKISALNPTQVYITYNEQPNDSALYLSDGSTGWYRLNPRQIPGSAQGPEPVWSPFATITGGCKLLQSVEVSAGIKKLFVGSTSANQQILKRDLTIFTDNGTSYDANFQLGNLVLARRGELAILKALETDFSGANKTSYTVGYLLNEISGGFTNFTLTPRYDPPNLYGTTITPSSYSPCRYYFSGTGSLARCIHLQLSVDFGTTSVGDEILNLTLIGAILKNQ
jgi:hypothetical protein